MSSLIFRTTPSNMVSARESSTAAHTAKREQAAAERMHAEPTEARNYARRQCTACCRSSRMIACVFLQRRLLSLRSPALTANYMRRKQAEDRRSLNSSVMSNADQFDGAPAIVPVRLHSRSCMRARWIRNLHSELTVVLARCMRSFALSLCRSSSVPAAVVPAGVPSNTHSSSVGSQARRDGTR